MTKFAKAPLTVGDCTVSVLRGGDGPPLLFLRGAGGGGAELPFITSLAGVYVPGAAIGDPFAWSPEWNRSDSPTPRYPALRAARPLIPPPARRAA